MTKQAYHNGFEENLDSIYFKNAAFSVSLQEKVSLMKNHLSAMLPVMFSLILVNCAAPAAGVLLTPSRENLPGEMMTASSEDLQVMNLARHGITVPKTTQPLEFLYNPRG